MLSERAGQRPNSCADYSVRSHLVFAHGLLDLAADDGAKQNNNSDKDNNNNNNNTYDNYGDDK